LQGWLILGRGAGACADGLLRSETRVSGVPVFSDFAVTATPAGLFRNSATIPPCKRRFSAFMALPAPIPSDQEGSTHRQRSRNAPYTCRGRASTCSGVLTSKPALPTPAQCIHFYPNACPGLAAVAGSPEDRRRCLEVSCAASHMLERSCVQLIRTPARALCKSADQAAGWSDGKSV
jgi:hypothetical protein